MRRRDSPRIIGRQPCFVGAGKSRGGGLGLAFRVTHCYSAQIAGIGEICHEFDFVESHNFCALVECGFLIPTNQCVRDQKWGNEKKEKKNENEPPSPNGNDTDQSHKQHGKSRIFEEETV